MDYGWYFFAPGEGWTRAYACGHESSGSSLSLAFLTWLEGLDVDRIKNTSALAGFLVSHSDLSRREIMGLLGTHEIVLPEHDRLFIVRLEDTSIVLSRGIPTSMQRETGDDSSDTSPGDYPGGFKPLSDEEFFEKFGDE